MGTNDGPHFPDEGSKYSTSSGQSGTSPTRSRRNSGCRIGCLFLLVLIFSLLGLAIWRGFFPFVHIGPKSISVGNSPVILINNEAYNRNSLRRSDPAPVRIHAGSMPDVVKISASNIPFVGAFPISYRQSLDRLVTVIKVDSGYRGSIDITVPQGASIKYDSHESGIAIDGLTGRVAINVYKGHIHVSNCAFSGPSLLKSYQGELVLQGVTLKYASSFESYEGAISFHGSLAPQGQHFFSSYKGAVSLKLPGFSSFVVDAYSYADHITTDFSGLQRQERELHGSIGQNPRAHLYLSSYESGITLEHEKGA
jgi:hypothetical protein